MAPLSWVQLYFRRVRVELRSVHNIAGSTEDVNLVIEYFDMAPSGKTESAPNGVDTILASASAGAQSALGMRVRRERKWRRMAYGS